MASESNHAAGNHLDGNMEPDAALRKIQTSGSITISPELFEKMYLSPQNAVKGELRSTVANPTPFALVGFLLCLSPLSCDLMGWRGAGGSGAAGTATYFFFGGLMMTVGSLGEFLLGNTFPMVVFGSFGAFWLSFAGTLQPFYNAYNAYTPTDPNDGAGAPGFTASFGFFLVFMGVLCLVYLILSIRTNLVFLLIFFCLVPAFSCLTAAYWYLAKGDPDSLNKASKLQIAGGAFAFVVSMLGWWIFSAIMLAALDFPFQLPVGDLSHIVKGASERGK